MVQESSDIDWLILDQWLADMVKLLTEAGMPEMAAHFLQASPTQNGF